MGCTLFRAVRDDVNLEPLQGATTYIVLSSKRNRSALQWTDLYPADYG